MVDQPEGQASPDNGLLWRLFIAYGSAVAALMLLSAPLSFARPELGAIRNWQIGLNALLFIAWAWKARLAAPARPLPRWLIRSLAAASLTWLLVVQLCRFYALTTNGVDFSIFDWMLYNTWHGAFGYSPIYGVNHFGVHPTFVLLPLVPLHRVLESPLLLVVTCAFALWSAIFPLWHLARHYFGNQVLAGLTVLAYLTCSWVGTVLDGGFRPEVFYPAAASWLLLSWVKNRRLSTALALAVFLSIKEDAALFAGALALGALFFERDRWKQALALLGASAAVFIAEVGWLQPLLLLPYGAPRPTYLTFWGQYGGSPAEILFGLATSPLRVARDLATSGWYRMFAPAFFLPLAGRQALVAMVPGLLLLGTASYATMHDWRNYYPLVMVPFFLWALLQAHQRLAARRWGTPAVAAALLLWPLVGGGYAKFSQPDATRLRDLGRVAERLAGAKAVCARTILFPHLPYALSPRPLDKGCVEQAGAVSVLNPDLDPWPYTRDRVDQMVRLGESHGRAERIGSFVLVTDPAIPVD